MIDRVTKYVTEHRFGCFIAICLVVSAVMTGISLKLYQMSGAIQLDMSRPGYEKVRTQVEKDVDDKPFDSNGKLDKKATTDFEQRINKYQNELKNLNNFDSSVIDDSNLGISDGDQSNGETQNNTPATNNTSTVNPQ